MNKTRPTNPADLRQTGLLACAGAFVLLYAVALTVSPAVRARTWEVDLRWQHWQGVLVWGLVFWAANRVSQQQLPERDPYILPLVGLLSGWGLLTIWRLAPYFGQRQTIWLLISGLALVTGLRFPPDLSNLRRYKYVWLTAGLVLTGLTLIFGTNPAGYGPRLWLGCCGVYFQPSEPLKFLLIVYLAAYLAGLPKLRLQASLPEKVSPLARLMAWRLSFSAWLTRLAPSLVMIGLALILLLTQRDLGTATIFIFLYTAIAYLATNQTGVLWIGAGSLLAAGVVGYSLFDVIQVRIEAWLNPWLDPSGRSFQIVQSLLAVANGGMIGRGPGLGSPGLVPISHSDFIFTSIAEESGLIGTLALFGLLALLAQRGFQIALRASSSFFRLLSAGITVWLVAQAVLIIGGNLRLLPLTGVTLPFMSYGGSSLLTSFFALLILLLVSNQSEEQPAAPQVHTLASTQLFALLLLGLVGNAFAAGWWGVIRGPDLLTRTDNPRRAINDRYVERGILFDRNGQPLTENRGSAGEYQRLINYPPLSVVIGYTHPIYGQTGLEASLDEYLRGLRGAPASTIWIEHLLYGQPPPGLDIRLTIDQRLQEIADDLFAEVSGAAVLIDASSGEILVMASHPGFDANRLDTTWESLVSNPTAPLLNRATLGRYPAQDLIASMIPSGLNTLDLDQPIQFRLPTGEAFTNEGASMSPLGVALAAAALSARGTRPAPQLVSAVDTPVAGWVLLPTLQSPVTAFTEPESARLAASWQVPSGERWKILSNAINEQGRSVSWYAGGTLPGSSGMSLAIAVAIESDNIQLADRIGETILEAALHP